jgi:hypothetical protein
MSYICEAMLRLNQALISFRMLFRATAKAQLETGTD